ncbi:MAG: YbjN domain-containing protein [Chloroflexota bacterium]|nr:YbjN domain-containing protein [Chloroflexota bacterium]
MSVTPETIEQYFDKYEWSYQRVSDNTFRTGFRGDVSSFVIYVRLTNNWTYFTIVPFVVAPKEAECVGKLYKHLLRLNHEINLAKFGVDSDGDIALSVELPREKLDYNEFSDALGALSYYADETYLEVLTLAQNPNAVSHFEEEKKTEEADDLDWGE